jgi:hypothetical protein
MLGFLTFNLPMSEKYPHMYLSAISGLISNSVVALVGFLGRDVTDIGDVGNETHAVAAILEPTADHIEGHSGFAMSEVRIGIDRRAAEVHADITRHGLHEIFFAS